MARAAHDERKLLALLACLAIILLRELQISGTLKQLNRRIAFVAGSSRKRCWQRSKQQMLLGGRLIREAHSPRSSSRAGMMDMLEGDLEDDWMKTQEHGEQTKSGINADSPGTDELVERFEELVANPAAATEEDIEAFMDAFSSAHIDDGPLEDEEEVRGDFSELELDPDIDEFDQSWVPVWLNETWRLEIRRLTSTFNQPLKEALAQSKSLSKGEAPDLDTQGDQLWPSATVFSRYLAICPHPINLKGKTVIEIGAGLSLPGIVSALLGAERVLLVDKDVEPLRASMETAVSLGVAAKITTLHARWEELPDLLSQGNEDLEAFSDPDLIFSVDNLLTPALADSVGKVVATLLTDERQAAYLMEPVREASVKTFVEGCAMDGLTAVSIEVQTWEPLSQEEQGFEWCGQLLTVRREEAQ